MNTFKSSLVNLVDEESRAGWIFNFAVRFLIIVSLISISVETLPDLNYEAIAFLKYLELFIVIFFTIEYLIRIYAAKKSLSYIFSFYGLIDLIAIAPYYLLAGFDLRSVRIFRLLRIVRLMKFSRYNVAFERLISVFKNIKAELVIFFGITMCVLYVAALGIYYFENPAQPDVFASVFHSLWWSVVTLTTVGYGDVYPITLGGRFFTFVILMIGLILIAVPTGLIASALSKTITDVADNEDGE